jgi:hypothetical protein
MSTIFRAIRDVLMVALLGCLIVVAWDVHRVIAPTSAKLGNDLDEIHRATLEIGLTAENVRKASAQWQQVSAQQAAYFTQATQKTTADLDAFHDLVTHTDAQINGQLLPALTSTVTQQNTQLAELEKQTTASLATLQQASAQLEPVLQSAAEASANAAKLSADPAIVETLQHIDATTASLASATASVDRQIRMIEPMTKKATTPPSKAALIFNTFLDLTWKSAGIVAGFVK